ncbi:threonine/serine ThrE exporter family protein [Gleimia europaea]|uniref:Threonine/serine exporter-like N-terminal domain-containing protein n=1 Tax=Gleimia europaea ACS-120-V-Col10b TaxID=883069 RepID=A0A9W5RCZ5_9ACTO|nr:threonine/serine exporter family protein [Gleimia europaea]EPD29414.1 hypothetical protein HMPREF9238_01615 [Gleimia europaea ACS-120-V-Col10b]
MSRQILHLFKRRFRKANTGVEASGTNAEKEDPTPIPKPTEDVISALTASTTDNAEELAEQLEILSLTEEEVRENRIRRERLAYQTSVVIKLGSMLMAAGAGSYRVKASMARLAQAIGIEKLETHASLMELNTTAFKKDTFRTEIIEQRVVGVNAARIDALLQFTRSLRPNMLAEDADRALDAIAAQPHLYSRLQLAVASGIGCAGFAFLNKGGLIECLAVLVAAFIGQYVRSMMLGKRFNHVATWMVCSAIAASIYIGMVSAIVSFGFADNTHQAGAVSAILFLVPGFPLVTAILDLVRLDLNAGITRGTYVAILMVSAGVSVWAVTFVTNWSVKPSTPEVIAPLLLLALNALATFIAATSFGVLFNTPLPIAATAGLVSALLNPLRILLVSLGYPNQAMVGLMSMLVGLFAALLSTKVGSSRVTLSVPAVVIMIPGVPFYRAITAVNQGETLTAFASIADVSFVILAIGVGLAISRMITDPGWTFDSPKKSKIIP